MRTSSIFLFVLLFSVNGFAQQSSDALDYLNQLTDSQQELSKQLMRYISASAHSNSVANIERQRNNLIEVTEQAKQKAEQTPSFQADAALRDAVLSYYSLSLESLTTDFKEIVALKDKASSSYELMTQLLAAEEDVQNQLKVAQERVEQEVEAYAKQHQIQLIKEQNQLSKMIAKSNEVTTYYNSIFLPMFKVNLQNVQLKEQIAAGNIDAIEQARKQSQEYAEEAREVFASKSAFLGDFSLLEAAIERVEYYAEEGNTMALISIEHKKQTQQLEQVKREIDQLAPKQRTKEQVDEYNELVDAVNASVNDLNNYADKFNTIGSQALAQWEQIVQEFRQRHIPKYELFEQSA